MGNLGLSVGQIARIVSGQTYGNESVVVDSVKIDSREALDNALFVAIKGERFDGHDFVAAADGAGAAAVLVEQKTDALRVPQVVVSDTLQALQQLGAARRRAFKGPVFAITGSAGKTTTRNILACLLEERFCTLKPAKNFNNHIGVPLTLLELEESHQAAVLELGCSDFGEIELLTSLVQPDVGLITNVGPAHLECLGDLAGVARAKGELFATMGFSSCAVVNLDDPYVAKIPVAPSQTVTFGEHASADVRMTRRVYHRNGQELQYTHEGQELHGRLSLLGKHNAHNALAAIAAARVVGLSSGEIQAGLAKVAAEAGRLNPQFNKNGNLILDDTYNSNPLSCKIALDTLVEMSEAHNSIAVLADMLELGDAGVEAHLEVGRHAASLEIKLLVTVGDLGGLICQGALEAGAPKDRCLHFDSKNKAAKVVLDMMGQEDVVLVKGSRGMRMEDVVQVLMSKGV